ncbi:MAG: GNAT family N-acetyltransferase [Candidatus Hydrogenedentes bacterium]|nr:GNAT family N-acetyltransferase [Candidatus Hydrogenedentota bacterium]
MEVVPLTPGAYAAAGAVTARAFADDPLMRFMLPDAGARQRQLAWIHARWFRVVAPLGGNFTTCGGEGVAVWWPPGGRERITFWRIACAGLLGTPLRVGWRAMRRMQHSYEDVESHAAAFQAPYWYLDILAVDPPHQGKGAGGSLIHRVTQQADAGRLRCYVITHNPRNVAYYERFGFRLMRETPLAPEVRTFSLGREPEPAALARG